MYTSDNRGTTRVLTVQMCSEFTVHYTCSLVVNFEFTTQLHV